MRISNEITNNQHKHRWIIAITGASGVCYAVRLLEVLAQYAGELHIIVSDAGLRVLSEELQIKSSHSGLSLRTFFANSDWFIANTNNIKAEVCFYQPRDIGAMIASGSVLFSGMVIIPCSMGTLGAIAHGISSNLIHRAAEVTMKEERQLILVPRESPLSAIHLDNMAKLAHLGANIVPAMPAYYTNPQTVADLIDSVVLKVLDLMKITHSIGKRWKDNVLEGGSRG